MLLWLVDSRSPLLRKVAPRRCSAAVWASSGFRWNVRPRIYNTTKCTGPNLFGPNAIRAIVCDDDAIFFRFTARHREGREEAIYDPFRAQVWRDSEGQATGRSRDQATKSRWAKSTSVSMGSAAIMGTKRTLSPQRWHSGKVIPLITVTKCGIRWA